MKDFMQSSIASGNTPVFPRCFPTPIPTDQRFPASSSTMGGGESKCVYTPCSLHCGSLGGCLTENSCSDDGCHIPYPEGVCTPGCQCTSYPQDVFDIGLTMLYVGAGLCVCALVIFVISKLHFLLRGEKTDSNSWWFIAAVLLVCPLSFTASAALHLGAVRGWTQDRVGARFIITM